MQSHYLHLQNVLNAEELEMLRGIIEETHFIDGKLTASMTAQSVKNNLQADISNQHTLPIMQNMVANALNRCALFHEAAVPLRLYPFIFSKYENGMTYGWHVDSPIMGNPPLRTDIAMTVFLSDPDTYEGGELLIESSTGRVTYKPNAGDAVMYPCTSLHCVAPVTSGVRLAAVTWIQSAIRNPEERAALFQVKQLHNTMYAQDPLGTNTNELLQIYSNLMRMWAEV
ncbi:MAG: Fe2+-dependent dioxygenase [Bacteroidia bacterium]